MQAYCMKCRRKREIKSPRSVRMKNRRPATQGVCPVCGTKVFRIGKGGETRGGGIRGGATIPPGPEFKIPKRREDEDG